MDYIDTIIKDLDDIAIIEINKYGVPTLENYNDVTNIAVDLAKKMNADIGAVQLGSKLMDIKLGQAISEKKKEEHINMALGFAQEFFMNYPLNEVLKAKVIACIKEHKDNKFSCIESEICANARCYNFLVPKKILKIFYTYKLRGYNYDEIFMLASEKVEEKWNKLTLDICKKELEENYKKIKEFLEICKN